MKDIWNSSNHLLGKGILGIDAFTKGACMQLARQANQRWSASPGQSCQIIQLIYNYIQDSGIIISDTTEIYEKKKTIKKENIEYYNIFCKQSINVNLFKSIEIYCNICK